MKTDHISHILDLFKQPTPLKDKGLFIHPKLLNQLKTQFHRGLDSTQFVTVYGIPVFLIDALSQPYLVELKQSNFEDILLKTTIRLGKAGRQYLPNLKDLKILYDNLDDKEKIALYMLENHSKPKPLYGSWRN